MYVIDKRPNGPQEALRSWYDSEFHGHSSLLGMKRSEKRYYGKVLRVAKRLEHLPRRPRILDVGCGTGKFLSVAQSFGECFGVDVSQSAIEHARNRAGSAQLEVAGAEALPFDALTFDLVTCCGSLEHFDSMPKALREFRRVLSADGLLYVEVPNLFFVGYYLRYCLLGRAPGTGQPLERYAGVDGWRELLRSQGFEPVWEHGRNYYRGPFSFSPRLLSPLVCAVWNLSAYLAPLHLRENYCTWARKSASGSETKR